jgi:hypothetical protein
MVLDAFTRYRGAELAAGAQDRQPTMVERTTMSAPRRSYGTGSLFVRADARGREAWYGKWWQDGRQIKRRLGAKRVEASKDGLTNKHAESELRRQIEAELVAPSVSARVTVKDAGERLIAHREALGRRQTTLKTYSLAAQHAPGPVP